jgi:RimJ/RimL family protein N-acetyltransferase
LRAAVPDDAAFLLALRAQPAAAAVLAVREGSEADLRAELAAADPRERGRRVLLLDGERVGGLAWELVNRRSRIAQLSEVILDERLRGHGLGAAGVRAACAWLVAEHDAHRVQLEVYGFNGSGQRAFERAGFTREGVRRQAYWRQDRWQDGVLYGLLADELGPTVQA